MIEMQNEKKNKKKRETNIFRYFKQIKQTIFYIKNKKIEQSTKKKWDVDL